MGPAFKPNPNQDALLDEILAERAALNAKRKLAPRPSKDGDDK
ncbi:hypothetical protein CP157_01109 [Paracoccus marcusii]|nr:hypothetical protein [Paracoccus marcusii]QXI63391.1 hypothetical protein CP157_01109 [Paracoccus marcusii]